MQIWATLTPATVTDMAIKAKDSRAATAQLRLSIEYCLHGHGRPTLIKVKLNSKALNIRCLPGKYSESDGVTLP